MSQRVCRLAVCLVWSYSLTAAIAGADTIPSFQGLGHLPGGGSFSSAQGVSADGTTVVGRSDATGTDGNLAFRWTSSGGMVSLGDLPGDGTDSEAYGASANGDVVVGAGNDATGPKAFRWVAPGPMHNLGDLPGGAEQSHARAVSADGTVVTGSGNTSAGSEAFVWREATGMVGLGDLPGGSVTSSAKGISSDGSRVAGWSISADGTEAFRWTEGQGMVGLGDLPGGLFFSQADDISGNGHVVVGFGSSVNAPTLTRFEAFRWTQATGMVALGDLEGGQFNSRAIAVSANGRIIVGRGSSDAGTEAFIWDEVHGMRSLRDLLTAGFGLDLTGWSLNNALGVSADGRIIVGSGTNPLGQSEAWIARIPEPATISLLTLGALAVMRRRRNR